MSIYVVGIHVYRICNSTSGCFEIVIAPHLTGRMSQKTESLKLQYIKQCFTEVLELNNIECTIE